MISTNKILAKLKYGALTINELKQEIEASDEDWKLAEEAMKKNRKLTPIMKIEKSGKVGIAYELEK